MSPVLNNIWSDEYQLGFVYMVASQTVRLLTSSPLISDAKRVWIMNDESLELIWLVNVYV